MHAPLSLLLLSALSLIAVTNGQHNVTVNNTSPLITYGGNARDSLMCKYTPEGTLVSGQGACWNVLPTTCTDGISMGQGGSGTASFSFKGLFYDLFTLDLSPILYRLGHIYQQCSELSVAHIHRHNRRTIDGCRWRARFQGVVLFPFVRTDWTRPQY